MSKASGVAEADATNGRVKVPFKKAVAMLPAGDDIHTFRQGGICLIGADWKRKTLLAAMKKHGVELAGEQATAMGHGLVLIDGAGAVFIATKESAK